MEKELAPITVFAKGMGAKLTGAMKIKYGEGPFEVVKVELGVRNATSHPQRVTLKLPGGEEGFSGIWLVPA